MSMTVSLFQRLKTRAAPLQNEAMDFEELELLVKLKKHRKVSEPHVRYAMYEAVVECARSFRPVWVMARSQFAMD